VPEARAFVTGALAGCPAGARDTLLLCATELCSNAIEHTASGEGGAFLVEVCRPAEGVACVAVTDGGGVGSPGLSMRNPSQAGCQGQDAQDRILADDLAEDGRGLALVAAFSSRWGYQPEIHTAWAEVAWLSPQPPVAVPKQGIWEDIDAQDAPGNDAA
jgi:anti-sigma regulatory factor (Ser/Thr protein kinase)